MWYNITEMEYFIFIAALLSLLYSVKAFKTLTNQKEILLGIMATQEEFDAKIEEMNTSLDAVTQEMADIATAVEEEAKQVAEFIAAHPDVDTSALDGVANRLVAARDNLSSVAGAVGGIFEQPAPEEVNETVEG